MAIELKRKLAAIMVADVVGYSRLVADDEEATLRRLEVFRTLWQDCLARTDGRIFNTAGDAVLAEFHSAVEAVRCALTFQAEAKAHNDGHAPRRQMHFRIGITIGDVVEREGDLLGDGVNIAARLQTLAGPGGICVSSWVREAVANKVAVHFTDLGEQHVKNIPGSVRAFLVRSASEPALGDAPQPQQPRRWLARVVPGPARGAMVLGLSAVALVALMLVAGLHGVGPDPRVDRRDPAEVRPQRTDAGDDRRKSEEDRLRRETELRQREQEQHRKVAEEARRKSAAARPVPGPPTYNSHGVRIGLLDEAAEVTLKPGDRFKECDACPEMVAIPRATYVMGSEPAHPGHQRDEAPWHNVTISTRLAIGRYPVTLSEYAAFVADAGHPAVAGCHAPAKGAEWVLRPELSYRAPGFVQTGEHPAVCVSWEDAKAYVSWLDRRTGGHYRLPSEAEREYFARAGTTSLYWWGNEIDPSRALYDWSETFRASRKAPAPTGTRPVAAFSSNPWGLFQVHGNVAEWVEDCWNGSYFGAPSDGTAWLRGDCRVRVVRGGSWSDHPSHLRSADRASLGFSIRRFNTGFRVARVLRGKP